MARALVVSLLLLVASASSACSLAGRTFGTYVDDKTITGAVKMRMARLDPRTAMRVNVDTFNGTVYLTGRVASAIHKSDAEIAAWQVEGVEQVVNDLTVQGVPERVVSASPVLEPPRPPLLHRIPGIARMDPPTRDGGALAYDRQGAIVATVYARPVRNITQVGGDELAPTVRPIDHVSVYAMPAEAAMPEAMIYLVFWHVTAAEAAALK
jgi:hypothetical protein